MADDNYATYASPALRWGLLLEDHPGADHAFAMQSGAELGIPDAFGGSGQFCVATITFPAESGKTTVRAWKPAPVKGNPDDWNTLTTKTLGRALKRAGYPDDLRDLKGLMHWRQRTAEISTLTTGGVALGAEDEQQALEAPRETPAHDGDTVTDAEIVGTDDAPDAPPAAPEYQPDEEPFDQPALSVVSDATTDSVAYAYSELSADGQQKVDAFMAQRGYTWQAYEPKLLRPFIDAQAKVGRRGA